MTKHIKLTGKTAPTIRDISVVAPKVKLERVTEAMGAEMVAEGTQNLRGAPPSLVALRQELARRLRSTGGRPSLEGTSRRQKIPLSDEDWSLLEELAQKTSTEALSATPGQIASVLLHQALNSINRQGA